MPSDTNTEVSIRADQAPVFECSRCGECCSSWNIPIEAEKAEFLLTRQWVQKRLREARRQLVKANHQWARLPLTDENVCVFLAEDKRCLIEVHEGPELKPDECKRFPFAQVGLSQSIGYDSSAACKLIAEKLLLAFQPVQPTADSANTLQQLDPTPEALSGKVSRGVFQKISLAQWEQTLAQLRVWIEQDNPHPHRVLRAVFGWLRHQTFSSAEQYPELSNRKLQWLVWIFLRKPYGSQSWLELLWGRAYHDPRLFGVPVMPVRFPLPPWPLELYEHVNAFLYHLLQRKIRLARGQSLEGLFLMTLAAYALLWWYAAMLSHLQERKTVAVDDLTMAIRLVERYYTGHQPGFLHAFQSRWLSALLFRLLM